MIRSVTAAALALGLAAPLAAQETLSGDIFNTCIAGIPDKAATEAQLVADGWTLLTDPADRAEALEILTQGFLPVSIPDAETTAERLEGTEFALGFWQAQTDGRVLAAQGDIRLFIGASASPDGKLLRIQCWAAGPEVPGVGTLLDESGQDVPVVAEMMLMEAGDEMTGGPGRNVIVMRQLGGEDMGLVAREGMIVTNIFELGQ